MCFRWLRRVSLLFLQLYDGIFMGVGWLHLGSWGVSATVPHCLSILSTVLVLLATVHPLLHSHFAAGRRGEIGQLGAASRLNTQLRLWWARHIGTGRAINAFNVFIRCGTSL